MKKILLVILLSVSLAACQKEIVYTRPILPEPHPEMVYTDLGNVSVKFGKQKAVDIDGDNAIDLLFSTMLVGDPILRRDKRQYYVNAFFDVFLLTNDHEETPALNYRDAITIGNHTTFNWYNASSVVVAEKIIEQTGPVHWEGNWKNADHKYLAVQLRKADLLYTGWVEASFKADTEELILHRAAIAVKPGKNIKAGF
jgi:hypothetical protein